MKVNSHMELLHSTIRENEQRKRDVAMSVARHQMQERMILAGQRFVVMQMKAHIQALVWGMKIASDKWTHI